MKRYEVRSRKTGALLLVVSVPEQTILRQAQDLSSRSSMPISCWDLHDQEKFLFGLLMDVTLTEVAGERAAGASA